MKNARTPRTLAESVFVTGYSSAELLQREAWANKWLYRLAFCVFVAFTGGFILEALT